jgi:hypothetical protein
MSNNNLIEIDLNPEAFAIAEQAASNTGDTIKMWLSVEVSKMLTQKKVAFARQRLNLHKKTVAMLVSKKMPGYETLEQAYISLGLSDSVATFGGIRKVYEEIYVKTGVNIPQTQIRLNNVVAVAKQA